MFPVFSSYNQHLASGELSDSTPCLAPSWGRRWSGSSTLGPTPGAKPSFLFCLSLPGCRSPNSLLLAFGGWCRTGSGDTAVTGPSPDILIFNPATRFKPQLNYHTDMICILLQQVLAEDRAESASACGLHFCCRFEQSDGQIFELSSSCGRSSVPVWGRQGGRPVQSPPLACPAFPPAGLQARNCSIGFKG